MKQIIVLFTSIILIGLSSCSNKCSTPFQAVEKEKKYFENGDTDGMWDILSDSYKEHFNHWAENLKEPKGNAKYLRLNKALKSNSCFDIDGFTGEKFHTLLVTKARSVLDSESSLVAETLSNDISISKISENHYLIYNMENDTVIARTPLVFEDRQWKYDIDKDKDDLILLMLFDYTSRNDKEKETYFCGF